MPEATDVLFLIPPMNPLFRPMDVVYAFRKNVMNKTKVLPLQLGVLSMAGYLLKEGFSVQYHDLLHFKGEPSLTRTIESLIKKHDPKIIGLTAYTSNFNAALKVTSAIKEINPNILTVVGGPHVTFLDEYSIEESNGAIDVVVRGEGEKTMHDIVYNHLRGRSLEENVQGITTKSKKLPDQPLLSNEELTELPIIPFELIPKREMHKKAYLPITATRGCTYKCSFCVNPVFWHRQVRFRDPNKIIEEILIAEERFAGTHIEFTDTILPINLKHYENLVDLYTKSITNPVLMALTRANLTDNRRLELTKRLLQDSGYLTIGLENGSQKVLELMNKPSWDDQLSALKKINAAKIISIPSWMVGFCGENFSTMMENMEKLNYLNKESLVHSVIMFIWIPMPGTPPFQQPKKYGVKIHTANWDYYDRAAFPPPYSLIDPTTGEITLSNLQIWSYFLSMFHLQKAWSAKRASGLVKDINFEKFLDATLKHSQILYFNPTHESGLNIYEDLLQGKMVQAIEL